MKEYFDERYQKHKKSLVYFYLGLFTGAMALIMFTVSVNSVINDGDILLTVTGFAAAVVWVFTANVSFYLYYKANRETMNSVNLTKMSK